MNISDLKNSIQNTPEKEMKSYILSLTRKLNLDKGHVLPMSVVLHETISLDSKQREAVGPAIDSLIEDGIFEKRNDDAFLTKKGKDIIYNTTSYY